LGKLTGFGWEQNVEQIKAVIARLPSRPRVVNMAGWSRGAVTCHMAAHMIQKSFAGVAVDIFAVDPVPGGVLKGHGTTRLTLPACVRHYTAILAEDDRKIGFTPAVVPVDASGLRRFVPIRGLHATMVEGAAELPEIAILCQHLADAFLTEHGTPLRKPIRLDDETICEFYAKIRRKIDRYRNLEAGTKGGVLTLFGIAPNLRTIDDKVP
jgi:hypothetical protein